jgi:hypothetical protein
VVTHTHGDDPSYALDSTNALVVPFGNTVTNPCHARPGKADIVWPTAKEKVKKSPVLANAAAPLDVRKACGFPASSPA